MISRKSAASLALAGAVLVGCGWVDQRAERREAAAERAYPPEGRILTLDDGRRVHAVVAGSGPDVVLIHGASGNTRDFTLSFAERLTDRYRVIVFDRPGLGYTDRASPAYGGPFDPDAESLVEQAAMLHSAAEKLGARRPIVLGHSYGGAVAMAWGLAHDPAALVIVSGATHPWPGELGPLYRVSGSSLGGAVVVPLLSAFATEGQVRDTMEVIFAPQPVPEGFASGVGAALSLRRDAFRANARQVGGLKAELVTLAPRYPSLNLPIEVVHGTEDEVVPPHVHAEPLAERVESARLTRLDGIGHMPHHAAPEAVEAAVDRVARRAGLR